MIWQSAPVLSSPSVVATRALTVRSVLDGPLARRRRIDAARIRELAGVTRCGDLGVRQVVELPALADLATTTASQLRLPDGAGWRIGQALGHAIEQGVRLWLCEVTAEAVPLISRAIGDDLIHIVSLPEPIAVPAADDSDGAAAPEAEPENKPDVPATASHAPSSPRSVGAPPSTVGSVGGEAVPRRRSSGAHACLPFIGEWAR